MLSSGLKVECDICVRAIERVARDLFFVSRWVGGLVSLVRVCVCVCVCANKRALNATHIVNQSAIIVRIAYSRARQTYTFHSHVVCVSVHVCVCAFVHICTYTYAHIHTQTHAHAPTHARTDTHTHMH